MQNQLAVIEQAQNTLIDLGIKFGPKVVVAILILVVGFYAGRWVGAVFNRWLGKLQLEPPVQLLLVRLARLMVVGLFLIMALQNLGIELLPLIAGLGLAGAGVALAMQGVLGNLVAGLTIIFTQPFRVGEYVAIVGVEGQVEEIDLFSTKLSQGDCSMVIVPNRKIVGEILHNYGHIRQLDLRVAIARADDLERALTAIAEVVKANSRVLSQPAAFIGVRNLTDASIGVAVKPWVKAPDYSSVGAEINLAIIEKIRAAGVDYPPSERKIRIVSVQEPH
ncbi:mechanosensitive ion channel family protein [Candidatus Nitrotoga sp. AM1P]|uniref:mechanosensitive ion channel family protein n=1 Tax=Candidatus Nitrotoga sp. AM1P TaxID=2559597 RepID=UPI0010B74B1A|nr:mechanosensitive ion channel family protein [Candidatus Nitrotoga sp. AM1P]BBJ24647.1 mechanosensitive ion channel protein [Candidatus Nitrotoga sp. AM1P]